MSAVEVVRRGSDVVARPIAYLGPDLFARYRTATTSGGAVYDPSLKAQRAPAAKASALILALQAAGFRVVAAPDVVADAQAQVAARDQDVQAADERTTAVEAAMAAQGLALYPFQRDGVRWLAGRSAALLADVMGTGKTVQALVAAPEGAPVLVIAPASIKGSWARETRRWRSDLTPAILEGRGSFRWPAPGQILICNYDILPKAVESAPGSKRFSIPDLPEAPAGTVLIADEAHAIKGSKTGRTRSFRCLARSVRAAGGKTWLVTGSPLTNRPQELWNCLAAAGLEKEAYGAWPNFVRVFRGFHNGWGLEWGSPLPEAAELLKRVMLRRRIEDVLPDLPGKTVSEIWVEIDRKTRTLCDKAQAALKGAGVDLDQAVEDASALHKAPAFAEVSAARAALATAKIPALLELVERYEEEGEPLVVFSAHRAPVDAMVGREGWAVITGDTPAADRTTAVEDFQAGRLKGIAGTIQAMGTGLTLTHSRTAVFVDLLWTPELNRQAEDRIHRIGQTRGQTIVLLLADHPMDSRVTAICRGKEQLVAASVEAAAMTPGEVPAAVPTIAPVLPSVDAHIIEGIAHHAPRQAPQDPPAPAPSRFRPAATDLEKWAAAGLLLVAGMDPDHARTINGVGFSKNDGAFGHDLAKALRSYGRLSDRQWSAAVKLATRYRRQIQDPKPEGGEE